MAITKGQTVIIFLLLAIIIVVLLPKNSHSHKEFLRRNFPAVHDYLTCQFKFDLQRKVPTFQGNVTYAELLEKVYKPYGFRLNYDILCTPKEDTKILFIPLKAVNECAVVFENWLKINDVPISNTIELNLPEELHRKFDLNNYTRLSSYLLGDAHNKDEAAVLNWTLPIIEKEREAVRNNKGGYPYSVNRAALFNAYKNHPPSGSGFIVGSIEPWAEGFALELGAEKVITQEYQIIKTEEKRITWKHPLEIAKHWETFSGFDFITTFSSIEHSGLGRYGDALDPIGDFREVQKIRCLLKPGGLLYIGLPSASGPWHEETAYNAHRVFGWVRWPAMAAGFEVIDVFDGDISGNPMKTSKLFPKSYQDLVFVLRKPL